jgi:hypothetical protein
MSHRIDRDAASTVGNHIFFFLIWNNRGTISH